jgi:hypothetical protein
MSSISITDFARSIEASIPHLDEFTLVTIWRPYCQSWFQP